jgi:hypothetical protein
MKQCGVSGTLAQGVMFFGGSRRPGEMPQKLQRGTYARGKTSLFGVLCWAWHPQSEELLTAAKFSLCCGASCNRQFTFPWTKGRVTQLEGGDCQVSWPGVAASGEFNGRMECSTHQLGTHWRIRTRGSERVSSVASVEADETGHGLVTWHCN